MGPTGRRRRVVALLVFVCAVLLGACSSPTGTDGPVAATAPTPAPASAKAAAPTQVSSPQPTPAGQQPATRPNLLVIETDDMRADELRWMPRTQALMSSGLEFANSFAPNPLCCPSRASLLTGQLSHHHGVLSHEPPYGFSAFDDSSTLATALQDAGYRTGLVGKYLNGYGEEPTREGRDSLTYVPPGWDQWWAASDHRWRPGDDFRGGTYDYLNPVANVNGEVRGWPGQYTTDLTARQTRDLVDRFARPDASGQVPPWFVWWNPVAPHHGTPVEDDDPGAIARDDGFVVNWLTPARPEGVRGRLDDEVPRGLGVPPDGRPESDRSDKPRYLRVQPELSDLERDALREVSRQRAEALTVLDRQVARTLTKLEDDGLAQDTLVVLTSDNGYYLGEHLKRQGKINLHEPSIRVPLLMAGPGVPQGRRFDPVTTVDLAATLAAYAGASLRAPDGLDLRPVVEAGDQGWTRPVALEGLMPEQRYVDAIGAPGWPSGLDTVGVRTARWKLVRYPTGEFELYDLRDDPLELRSLGDDPTVRPVRRALKRVWLRTVGCRGEECRTPLPPLLREGPEDVRALTSAQERRTQEYYRGSR